jgi:IS30 family transposase
LMLMRREGASLRAVARALQRSPSSMSREVARHRDPDGVYTASVAGERARVRTLQHRRHRKLGPGTVLFGVVEHFLREAWSPEPIAGTLRNCYPTDPAQRVSHETLYQALYGLPRGAVLRSELLGCLRQGPHHAAAARTGSGPAGPDRQPDADPGATARDRRPRRPGPLGGGPDQG